MRLWMFNAALNNISVICWQSALLFEETRENQLLHHINLYRVHIAIAGDQLSLVSPAIIRLRPRFPHL